MNRSHIPVCDVRPGLESSCIRCRVVCLWCVRSSKRNVSIDSMELVLVDSSGDRIHASVLRPDVGKFFGNLVHNGVYEISSFFVAKNRGLYRTALHSYRIVLNADTSFSECPSDNIPLFGLTLSTFKDIYTNCVDYDFLIDVLGYVTGFSLAKECLLDGRNAKISVMELCDGKNKIGCVLDGHLLEPLKQYAKEHSGAIPVVLQFAKIKMFRGNPTAESVPNVTRILIDPDIPQVRHFKNIMTPFGFGLKELELLSGKSDEDNSFCLDKKRTISELKSSIDFGRFVVTGTVTNLVKGVNWCYRSFTCRGVFNRSSRYKFNKESLRSVLQPTLRFRVKCHVSDGTGSVVFVLHDCEVQSLIGRECIDLLPNVEDENFLPLPAELLALEGKSFVFSVEKKNSVGSSDEVVFVVDGVWDDEKLLGSPVFR